MAVTQLYKAIEIYCANVREVLVFRRVFSFSESSFSGQREQKVSGLVAKRQAKDRFPPISRILQTDTGVQS